jgi:hypothetical protein
MPGGSVTRASLADPSVGRARRITWRDCRKAGFCINIFLTEYLVYDTTLVDGSKITSIFMGSSRKT